MKIVLKRHPHLHLSSTPTGRIINSNANIIKRARLFCLLVHSFTVPYLYILLFQKLHILKIPDLYHSPIHIINIMHLLFLVSYFWIVNRYLRSGRSLQDAAKSILLIFSAYFAFAAFQFSAWFLIWILPFLLLSNIKEMKFIALTLSFIGLVSFYKRISFLLSAAAIVYLFYKLLMAIYLKRKSSKRVPA